MKNEVVVIEGGLFQGIGRLRTKTVVSDCEACRLQIRYQRGVRTLPPI